MLEFIILGIIVIICALIFGKADTKRELLNQVGLDLSESSYNSKKESEFAKYSKKAIKIASEKFIGKTEKEFLDYVGNYLGDHSFNNIYIGVKSHYVYFAYQVINRRKEAIKKNEKINATTSFTFTNSSSLNSYIKWVWDNYQYPWPKDWLKKDGI